MAYDDVIPLLGDFGSYQRRVYFLLCLPAILCAFHKLGNVFLIAEPKYRCQLPFELENASYALNESVWKQFYPWDDLRQSYSSCNILANNKSESCDDFIFDHDVYGYTSVIEFKLTCLKAPMIATSNSLFMVGVMLGSLLFGECSDRYGRKPTFFISLVIQVVFGIAAAFAPEFWTFTFARLVVGMTTSGVFLVAYVIGLEMVGPKYRPVAGTICHMFFSLGYMLTAVFATYIYEWRELQFALTIPGIIFMCYWWFIPESPRWLITNNRIDEAKRLILIAAKANGKNLDDEKLTSLITPIKSEIKENDEEVEQKKVSILDVFKYPNLRKKSLIIFFDWFANNITYYGLSWNTNNLGGNPYLNFVISGAVELPAYAFLLLFLNRWGRRNLMCGCMMVSGLALLLTMAVPKDKQWLSVTLAMIGKLSITASYAAVYIFSSEQFPTVIRNAGIGAGSTCARIGSILAPYINIMTHLWQPLPLLIFGSLTLIGGLMSMVLPETLNKKLPETIEEGEAFGKRDEKTDEETSTIVESNGATNGTNKTEEDAESTLLPNGTSSV